MKLILAFTVSLIICYSTKAQITPPARIEKKSIEVIGKSFLDSVIIRWAPTSSDMWLKGNNYGYRIIRKTVGMGDSIFNDSPVVTELTGTPIKPMILEEIRPIAEKDMYAGIVAQAIYGQSFDIATQSPESLINKAKEIDNRYSFSLFSCDMSKTAALVHGLIYTDNYIEKEGHYIYQIILADPKSENKYDTGLIYIHVADTFALPKPFDVKAAGGDKNVTLRWNKQMFNDIYSAYVIERSDDGKTFIRRNENPMVNLSGNTDNESVYNIFVDSIPDNRKKYIYRVRGISPLGELGPPSDTVNVRGEIAMYMMNPMITSSMIIPGGQIKIHWEIPYADSIYANEFQVLRSETSDGKFEIISASNLSGKERDYFDQHPLGVNYYVIESIDELGRRYRSFPSLVMLEDSIPPCIPSELKGTCDSLGIINLSWKPCKEKDLAGYKIFRYNNPAGEPMKINESVITDTSYNDTLSLNTLTNYFYYSVVSFDNHYNQSDYSEIVRVRLYDTIAPPEVSFTKFETKEGVISLFWNKNPASDALNYLIYRKQQKDTSAVLIAKCGLDETQYSDSSNKGSYNEYQITCIDEVGNESSLSQALGIKALPVLQTETPEVLIKSTGNKSVKITYKSQRTDIKRVMIYRSINDEPLTLNSSQEYSKEGFTDNNLIIGNIYTYRIQFVYKDGTRSRISNSVINKL